jgi:urease subunit gamma
MIRVKATVRGEPDVPPFTRVFDYDEQVFFTSAAVIEEKIRRNMKINANEALVAYCSYVVKSVHAGSKDGDIQKGAAKVLSANNVMIGVPETLQTITFETTLDNRVRRVTIKEPIPASSYMMAEH